MIRGKRKVLKNIKPRQTIMGTIIIALMLVIGTVSFVNINSEQVKAEETPTYVTANYDPQAHSDFDYYKLITIESDYVAATLGNFPILISDTSADYTNNILANGSDIAFYSLDNNTQYNHEIEYFDKGSGVLVAWVNITSLAAGSDTLLYMYYGDVDGGRPIGYNPTLVWDGNYTAVYHLNETTGEGATCWDSTANSNDQVYEGNLPNGTLAYGVAGNGQFFKGSEFINLSDFGYFSAMNGTLVLFVSANSGQGGSEVIYSCWDDGGATYRQDWSFRFDVTRIDTIWKWDTDGYTFDDANDPVPWYQMLYEGWTNGEQLFMRNTTWATTLGTAVVETWSPYIPKIGCAYDESLPLTDSYMDEVRFSNIMRNDSWVNATYYSIFTAAFLTIGAQGTQEGVTASVYTLVGLPNTRLTWSGVAGTTVWCNNSGDAYETIEVNMTVNSTDNVSELRIYIGNLNDTSEWVNASNLSVVFSSDNTSWAGGDGSINTTSFTDGGSNISVNTSQWSEANGMYGTNPFTAGLGGIANKNVSVWMRVKLAIPSGSSADDFWSTSGTAWTIYIGHYT